MEIATNTGCYQSFETGIEYDFNVWGSIKVNTSSRPVSNLQRLQNASFSGIMWMIIPRAISLIFLATYWNVLTLVGKGSFPLASYPLKHWFPAVLWYGLVNIIMKDMLELFELSRKCFHHRFLVTVLLTSTYWKTIWWSLTIQFNKTIPSWLSHHSHFKQHNYSIQLDRSCKSVRAHHEIEVKMNPSLPDNSLNMNFREKQSTNQTSIDEFSRSIHAEAILTVVAVSKPRPTYLLNIAMLSSLRYLWKFDSAKFSIWDLMWTDNFPAWSQGYGGIKKKGCPFSVLH